MNEYPQDSPEWLVALAAAHTEGISIRHVGRPESAVWAASSRTDRVTVYLLTFPDADSLCCTCDGGQNGNLVCAHRALFFEGGGMLTLRSAEFSGHEQILAKISELRSRRAKTLQRRSSVRAPGGYLHRARYEGSR